MKFSGLASTRMSPFQILLELRVIEVAVTAGAIRWAKLHSEYRHQQTNAQFFYRSDAIPVTQPTVSKHWRETRRAHTSTKATDAAELLLLKTRQVKTYLCRKVWLDPI